MPIRYISVFSGIEAATLAWEELGWKPVCFSEIHPFRSAVLAHHYPKVKNVGDLSKVDWRKYRGAADLVCGGSPCVSFSVAGLRKGLADPRGNLVFEFLRVVDEVKPRWVFYENVPGLLSAEHGKVLGSILAAMGELGYGFAYRVLDASGFGVPQSRRRFFLVGYLGDWRPAAAVLFDGETVSLAPTERRRQGTQLPDLGRQSPDVWCIKGAMIGRSSDNGPRGWSIKHNEAYTLNTVEVHGVCVDSVVRKLTPLECERLQGLPDNYTLIDYKGQPSPSSQRYEACARTWAVPVAKWFGERVQDYEDSRVLDV